MTKTNIEILEELIEKGYTLVRKKSYINRIRI